MAKIFLFLFLCILTVSAEEPPRVIIDETRYADLLEDPYSRRILGVIFHVENGVGAYRFTEDEQADRRWFDERGAKAFPVLLEVQKREPSPVDSPKSPEAWHGMIRTRRILGWISHFPEGEFQPFVEEVRRQMLLVKELPNRDYIQSHFLREVFNLLAQKGDESDIPRMEKFLDDEDVGNRDNARASIAKLRARLDAEKAGQTAPAKDGPSSNQRVQAVDPDGNLLPPTPGNAAAMDTRIPLWLKWAISLLVVAGIFWHWRSRAKGKSKDGPAVK
jgi:hypothetical protein